MQRGTGVGIFERHASSQRVRFLRWFGISWLLFGHLIGGKRSGEVRSYSWALVRILGRFRSRKLRSSLLEKNLESRMGISDQEKCWPRKGRQEQVG